MPHRSPDEDAPSGDAGARRTVLLAFRSAGALHRLLDVLPVFEGDPRISRRFTLVPGSRFDVEALAALDRSGARLVDWEQARTGAYHLVLTASPKGELRSLSAGRRALLPHGVGFNKALGDEGSPELPSGLDPAFLLDEGEPWADLHGLAHDDELARLAEACPPAAPRAVVVGDPTLDRLLRTADARESRRAALGVGDHRLVVLLSTWGPESLLARRPELPQQLVLGLPVDRYRVGLAVHPNEFSERSPLDLAEQFRPATRAGLLLASPYQEWAALLAAADAVITDHGSSALYAAAAGCAVISAYDGGSELLPGSPMAELLAAAPQFTGLEELPGALRTAAGQDARKIAATAFARPGEALPRLRQELYRLLELTPPAGPLEAEPFPPPAHRVAPPDTLAVGAEVSGTRVRLDRYPVQTTRPVHHLAADHPRAGLRARQSSAVLWRHADSPVSSAPWTADGWLSHVLAEHPGCRTAAVVLAPDRCLLRHRRLGALTLRAAAVHDLGRIRRADPAALVSAAHAWLDGRTELRLPVTLHCEIGALTVDVDLVPAESADGEREV
ncbi:translation initiation factor 2 [Kitasatospora sp. NPDC049285]|uniref:translation initiation factor 2 n=1 Tax=Kitasatospora sp. NPDC049285 TaxID=3157096 RepID=UPI0034262904